MVHDNDGAGRDSFIFYRSFAHAIINLPADDQLLLFRAVVGYGLDRATPSFADSPNSVFLECIWAAIKPQLDANQRRYENGCKGGAPKGSHNNPNGRRGKTNQKLTENKPNGNVNGNDNDGVAIDTRKGVSMAASGRGPVVGNRAILDYLED